MPMKQIKTFNTKKLFSKFIPDAVPINKKTGQAKEDMEVFFSEKNDWVVIIKKDKPITEKEIMAQHKKMAKHKLVFISAFKTMEDFQKHSESIPWKTHVWLADTPEHMIHFNGDRFMESR